MPRAKNKNLWDKVRLHAKRKLRHRLKHYRKLVKSNLFAKRYAVFCLVVLFATTVFWSLLGANLQHSNADQLVNPYLFDNSSIFHGALFPGSHSMLIKWPLFIIMNLLGFSGFTYVLFTLITVLITIGALVYILYKIDSRPAVFGTFCLALASVLLLVPAQPYAGGLLPVNIAMVTTRNIEYVFYIACLALFIRTYKSRSLGFWLSIILLSLLIASDKLFFSLSFGGAFLALVFYFLLQKRQLAKLALVWLAVSAVSMLGAVLELWFLNHVHVTHIVGGSGFGPFGMAHHLKDWGLGGLYGTLGIFTNFGANPVFDATIVRHIPHQAYVRLIGVGGISYIVNIAILGFGVFSAWKLMASNLFSHKEENELDTPSKLSIMLIWSTLAGLVAYILSKHYYAVDSRYLTISLFAILITTATYLRKKPVNQNKVLTAAAIICVSIFLGLFASLGIYHQDKKALADISSRNKIISQVIDHQKVDVLLGDYWRVLPIKLLTKKQVITEPLIGCLEPQAVLTSDVWKMNLNYKSFAYLLSLDSSLTNYPKCTLDQVIAAYGRPNTSTLIAGDLAHPKELLLYYDNGINRSSPTINAPGLPPSTVLPIFLSQLPNVNCQTTTVMQTVAHQDDDLLFMTPDLLHDLHDGKCVRTLYLTAGDAGSDQFYWLSREQGSEAAYSKMIGYGGVWIKRIVRLGDNQYIRVDNPRGNSKVSLIFMRLADGNLKGQGFRTTNYESLEKLETGKIGLMHSVDKQSTYSYSQLQNALLSLMRTYGPSEIHTQATFVDHLYPDHSDHIAVSRLTKRAWVEYDSRIPIKHYIGYPSYARPQNVFGIDLQQTEDAFFGYAKYDPAVCGSEITCQKSKASYGSYLHTQYTNPE